MKLLRKSLLIRSAEIKDLSRLTEIYNHYVLNSIVTFDITPFTTAEREKWFKKYSQTGPYRILAAKDETGDIVGYATSSQFRPRPAYATSVETSVYVAPNRIGAGVGTKLYTALFQVLGNEDLHRAYAGIALPNPASVALHKKFDFYEIGIYEEVGRKFNQYWNVQWFEKDLT